MIFTNSIETRPNEIKASRKSRSKNFQKFVFFPTHGRRKKFYLRGGILKPLKKWLLSMIRMETDTTPLYHRIQLGCQDTRTLITLQTFDGAHSNGEVGRIERRQAHGENRKRKGFLIGGVRLQWRRASGLEGRPLPQGFKASWLWKQRGKTSWKRQIQHAASGSLSNSCSHLFNPANEWALENFAIILWLISITAPSPFNQGEGCFSRRETRRLKKHL